MTPLNEQAYQHLQKLIIQGEFEYNKIYSETKLSRELGISRTPFRDAVHRLAQEGYIDIIRTSTRRSRSVLPWNVTALSRSRRRTRTVLSRSY